MIQMFALFFVFVFVFAFMFAFLDGTVNFTSAVLSGASLETKSSFVCLSDYLIFACLKRHNLIQVLSL